jgi:hypothetical protein
MVVMGAYRRSGSNGSARAFEHPPRLPKGRAMGEPSDRHIAGGDSGVGCGSPEPISGRIQARPWVNTLSLCEGPYP